MTWSRPAPKPPLYGVDPDVMAFLELHEARCHGMPGRVVRDLGDAVLLHDPASPEPFWNRVSCIRWPEDRSGFDRRLAEIMTVFASIDRRPHIWLAPAHNTPADLGGRLRDRGFVDLGGGNLMVLADEVALRSTPEPGPDVSVERNNVPEEADRAALAEPIAEVLLDAFDVDPVRRGPIAEEVVRSYRSPAFTTWLLRVDGEPAAVAKATTFDGATYLSSIGVRRAFRGRGLGGLVTRLATEEGLALGSTWTYLGVFADNRPARRMYERLGFVVVGERAGDLLLR